MTRARDQPTPTNSDNEVAQPRQPKVTYQPTPAARQSARTNKRAGERARGPAVCNRLRVDDDGGPKEEEKSGG